MIEPLEPRQLLATDVTVMTQNVYYGGGSGAGIFASAFTDLWQNVEQSKIPERAAAIAAQIKRQKPDLVALQEAVIWRTGSPFSPSRAKDVRLDFVAEILRPLRKGRTRYKLVSRSTNADWEIPAQVGSSIRDLRMTDQDVILARVGRDARLTTSNPRHGNYRNRFTIPLPGIDDIDFTRGWASIDARVGKRGPRFRFINTHLEVFNTAVQEQQARQFLKGPAKTRLPVIVAGDINTTAGTTTYRLFDSRFEDAWPTLHPGQSGPTCCQDDDLRNRDSKLSTRIDTFFYSDQHLEARSIDRINENPADKTPSGLWPSDHAGLFARIQFD